MKETYQNESSAHTATSSEELILPSSGTRTRERITIVLAILALYIIWGSTYLGMRIALEGFPPFIMAGVRFVLAGSILYTIQWTRRAPHPTRKQWLGAAIIGTLLLAGGNGGVSIAEQWVASGLAAVAIAAVPLWTSLFMGLMGRWPTRMEWLGLGLGLVGVACLNLEHGIWASPVGALVLLLAPLCWALGSALSSRIPLPNGLTSSAAQMITGGVVMLLLSQVLGEKMHGFPNDRSLWAMAFLIIFGSLIAFSAYGYLLRKVRPALATSYAYVNPLVAVGLGVGLAGEHITIIGLLAMFVILAGVGLVSLGRMRS